MSRLWISTAATAALEHAAADNVERLVFGRADKDGDNAWHIDDIHDLRR